MKNQKDTIRKFISYLNNPEKEGGFWLPNIQRAFVWKEEQIERLFDSILREYPIGSLLIWKTKSPIKIRKFIDTYNTGLNLLNFYKEPEEGTKFLVLDGQQRLQSLYIGLHGSYDKKELYLDILSGDLAAPEDVKYNFHFLHLNDAKFPYIKVKSLVLTDKTPREIKKDIVDKSPISLSEAQHERIDENIDLIRNVFCQQENIIYQEVDSIDRELTYSDDDIVEIFIRANNGGTVLNKSDLMFSLLISSWDEAEENMFDLLESLNRTGYAFSRDFILKTCLVLLNKGARYNVDKFREPSVKNAISDNWDEIVKSIQTIKDLIYGKTYLKTDKIIPSYLSLIPLIYFRYHFKNKWASHINESLEYILRVSLTGVFSGQPDNLIDKLIQRIRADNDFILNEMYGVIRENGRNLEISGDMITNLNYWKKEIHLFFNIWYGFNYQPALNDNKPQIDHIFPQSMLRKVKLPNPNTGKMNIMKYTWQNRDQLANLMLLTAEENGAGNKSDTPPDVWFRDKDDAYLDRHLIPKDPKLWTLNNYEHFLEKRRKLILDRFSTLIYRENI